MAEEIPTLKRGFVARVRNYFLTGLLVTAPPALTIYLTILFVNFIDETVRGLIPDDYNPEHYLPYSIPGLGVVAVILAFIIIGAFTTGYIGRFLMRLWEAMWAKMPFLSGIYSTLKQIFETVFSQKSNAFNQVVLVEFPRKGCWTKAFVTADVSKHLEEKVGRSLVSVYVPTTPNPTSGYWVMYPRDEVIFLDTPVEDALKTIISLGIVTKK